MELAFGVPRDKCVAMKLHYWCMLVIVAAAVVASILYSPPPLSSKDVKSGLLKQLDVHIPSEGIVSVSFHGVPEVKEGQTSICFIRMPQQMLNIFLEANPVLAKALHSWETRGSIFDQFVHAHSLSAIHSATYRPPRNPAQHEVLIYLENRNTVVVCIVNLEENASNGGL
ncbi:MAG: hypothetical protein HS102_07695 [Planctomycetia bacterium]|nr:hypothetical protein [Planctomycetia bacterium]